MGSTASNVNVAGTTRPFWPVRAVAKTCVWKPGGKLVDEELTSIQRITAGVTVTVEVSACPLSVVAVTMVLPSATPVAVPLASTVAMVASPVAQVMGAFTTKPAESRASAAKACDAPTEMVAASGVTVTLTGGPPPQERGAVALFRGAGVPTAKSFARLPV